MLAAGRQSRRQLAAALAAARHPATSSTTSAACAGPSSAPRHGQTLRLQTPLRRSIASSSRLQQQTSTLDNDPEQDEHEPQASGRTRRQGQDSGMDRTMASGSGERLSAPARQGKKPVPIHIDADSFPSLLREPHPVLDRYTTFHSTPDNYYRYPSSVTFFNTSKSFPRSPPSAASKALSSQSAESGSDNDSAEYLETITPLQRREIASLQQHLISFRRIVKMTGKGKIARMSALVVAGNNKGLVGMGEGKDENTGKAAEKAFQNAVKNMDYVERHEDHTIPAEVTCKWVSSKVTLRPRPRGHGLQVPPVIHRVARACGITDLSATIVGSTNNYNVLQATLSLLWGGRAPLGMGDGIGGQISRGDRGKGMRTLRDIELMRGRRLREIAWPKPSSSK